MLKVKYTVGVNTNCGWRSKDVVALAEQISEKRVKIVEVLEMEKADSRRQQYNKSYFAEKEVGKTKNISSVEIIEA